MRDMAYKIDDLPFEEFFLPVSKATAALARLDERLSRSPIRNGMIERMHMHDATASMWLEGELVHLEDLVLHDALMDNRTPSHALTIAHSIVRMRRQIENRAAGWALSSAGIQQLLGRNFEGDNSSNSSPDKHENADPLLDDIDALLARTDALLKGAVVERRKAVSADAQPLIYDEEWDEAERLQQWRDCLSQSASLPPLMRAAVLHDAWYSLEVVQRSAWIGRLLTAASLRKGGIAANHLPAISIGLRSKRPDERRSRNRLTRLLT